MFTSPTILSSYLKTVQTGNVCFLKHHYSFPTPEVPFFLSLRWGWGICNSANVTVLEVASSRGGRAGEGGGREPFPSLPLARGASQRGPHGAPAVLSQGRGVMKPFWQTLGVASIPSVGRPSHLEAK